jgi:hypothetical protein
MGKMVALVGVILVVVGGLMTLGGKIGLGRLPGDISVRHGGASYYFPIATSIVLSVVLTIVANLLLRRR